jgi:hypothetical protein
VKLFVGTGIAFFAIDLVWLGVIAPAFYQRHLGHLRAEQVLRESEELLLGLDEEWRRARFPDLLAAVYLFQGRTDEALIELRVAFENGWRGTPADDNHLYFIEYFAKFDPLRDDPRFVALIDDIGADLDRQRRSLERDGLAITD